MEFISYEMIAANTATKFKLNGPNLAIPTACAAGNYSIGYACDLIKKGAADIMLAGGADAFSRMAFIGFNRLLAVIPPDNQFSNKRIIVRRNFITRVNMRIYPNIRASG